MQPTSPVAVIALVGFRGGRLPALVSRLRPPLLGAALRIADIGSSPSPSLPLPLPLPTEDIDASVCRLRDEILTALIGHIRENGLLRGSIATRMGVTPGRVSQILSGHENLTLRSIATLSAALQVELRVTLEDGSGARNAARPVSTPDAAATRFR